MADDDEVDLSALGYPGYRLTPKGVMAVVLVKEFGSNFEEAMRISTEMDDTIFDMGYTYIHASNLNSGILDGLGDDDE